MVFAAAAPRLAAAVTFHAPCRRAVSVRASAQAPVTDESVPEGHQGLHTTLYDSGDAASAHAESGTYRPVEGEDDGGLITPVDAYLEARDGFKPPGVFAIYDSSKTLQYVGFSRNIVLSVKTLKTRLGPDRVAHVRALVVANQAMQTRASLQKHAQSWLDQADGLPPGNGPEADLWGGGGGSTTEASVDLSVMSAAELAAYEDKKLKLKKAMGEKSSGQEEAVVEDSADERRRKMKLAVEGGDWSVVIEEQTRATLPAAAVVAAASAGGSPTSPFTQANVHRKIGEASDKARPAMTRESVAVALEEVRPYLQADGGDLEIVGVEDGIVSLRLEGACSTCPSSSATLKMGIERALSAAFGDGLKGVVQVDKIDSRASVSSVDEHLNLVRPAIVAMKGAVEVVSVEGGKVVLRYKGPPPLAKGLVAAVKDKFPEITNVDVTPFA